MKIAIIGDRGIPARYSGFSTLVEELAVRLAGDHRMDVTVYCRNHYYTDRPKTYRGVRCVYLPAPGGKSFESIIHSTASILHAACGRYDLAFIVDPGNSPFALPLVLRRVPCVFHTDGMGWKRLKWNWLQRRYYKWSERVCTWMATRLVTDARAMQAYYQSEYGSDSTFIPYGANVGAPPNVQCLQKYGLAKNGYYLVVARLERENNTELILREYKASGVRRPLVVVGGSRYDSALAQRVFGQADDQIRCLGPIYESDILNGLYANCYMYLHGHEVGGTNPSLLRAMGAGAACLAIDVSFHREALGANGLYFEKAEGSLARRLAEVEGDEERVGRMGPATRDRAERLYRWDAVAEAYAGLFRAIVEGRVKGAGAGRTMNQTFYHPETVYQQQQEVGAATGE